MQSHPHIKVSFIEQPTPLRYIDISSRRKLLGLEMKRFIDVVGAIIGIVILSPVMIVIAFGIKYSSPGPVLFTQKRAGFRGKLFTFFKFRTMSQNNDNSIHRDYVTKLINGEIQDPSNCKSQKPLFKLSNDKRVTRFGKFLRTWSLDELPQLFNVLKGEMSLVGPRPAIPYEIDKYNAWHLQRLDALPGITGLWQVRSRSKTTFAGMVRLDIQYIKNWSLWVDFKILIQTLKAVLRRDGAL